MRTRLDKAGLVLPKALRAELEEWRERRELGAGDSVRSSLVEAERENIEIEIFLVENNILTFW